MSVAQQDVGPAVIVEIQEPGSPSQEARVAAESGLKRDILEGPLSQVAIQTRRIPGEIRLHDVEPPVAVVVRGGNPHARLCFAVRAEGYAGFGGDVRERAVPVVAV